MNEKIKNHVDELFSGAPKSRRAAEMRDELATNLNERYADLVQEGKSEDEAFAITIAGIGDLDDLIRSLRNQDVLDPIQMQMQRQKSALLTSVAVALYIVSFIFPIMFGAMEWNHGDNMILGVVLMFVCWAAATMLLVYNALSKPKYQRVDNTLVEEFKEWKATREKDVAVQKSITSLVWLVATVIFLVLGFFAGMWPTAWIIFLIAAIANHVIKLARSSRGDDR